MEITYDLFSELEELYRVKARHLKFLKSRLPDSWQATIPGGYRRIWEKRGWKFYLSDIRPVPRPIELLVPDRLQIETWVKLGLANELITGVSPESLGRFLERYVHNPRARRNLEELYFGEDAGGPGFKAFGSLVVCATEENRFLQSYMPMLEAFCESDPRQAGVDEEMRELALGFFRDIDDLVRYLESDVYIFKRFNRDLKELFTERIRVGVLGVGEISSVLTLSGEFTRRRKAQFDTAYKRMPPFEDRQSVFSYAELFDRYHRVLKEVGLSPPRHGVRYIDRDDGTITVYATQRRVPSESIGSCVIHELDASHCRRLFRMVLEEARKVTLHNQENPRLLVGLDIQISNWGVEGYDPENPRIEGDETLLYVDTSTPLLREDGVELLDTGLFLKSVPSFLRPVVRGLFLEEVLDRYYDTRKITIDLIANFVKEGRPDLVEMLVEEANDFMDERLPRQGMEHISVREVRKYYRRDRIIWIVFQAARRIDRFIQTRLLGRSYPYRLPEEVGLLAGRRSKKRSSGA